MKDSLIWDRIRNRSFSTAFSPQNTSTTFVRRFLSLASPSSLVGGIKESSDRFGVTEEDKEGIGFGFLAFYDFGVELAPTFP